VGRVLRAVIKEGGGHPREPLSLIVKTAPTSKVRRDLFRTDVIFSNEANVYRRVLPILNAFLKTRGLSDSDHYPNTPR